MNAEPFLTEYQRERRGYAIRHARIRRNGRTRWRTRLIRLIAGRRGLGR